MALSVNEEARKLLAQQPKFESDPVLTRKRAVMAAKDKKSMIAMEPNDKIRFVGDFTQEIKTHLKITNKSDMKQAFKIKCTRNDLFKIRPATGILDYNQTSNITLTYKPNGEIPENDKHHFGVYHIPAPEGCTCEGAWSEHYGPPQGEFRLKVQFEEAK